MYRVTAIGAAEAHAPTSQPTDLDISQYLRYCEQSARSYNRDTLTPADSVLAIAAIQARTDATRTLESKRRYLA